MGTEVPSSPWARLSLAARLVLAFTSLAVAALMVALVVTTLAVERAAEEKIARDLDRALDAFQRFSGATQERILEVSEAHVSGQTLKDVFLGVNSEDDALGLGDGDAEEESIEYARELIISADEAVVFGRDPRARLWALFNASGSLVYTHAAPEERGTSLAGLEVLQRALREGPASALWSPEQLRALPFTFVPPEQVREGELLLVHAQPALGPRRTAHGVVLTGRWVGELLLASFSGGSGQADEGGDTTARFVVRARDGALATPPLFPAGTVLEEPGFSAPEVRRVRLGSVRHLVREDVFRGLGGAPLGRVFVLRDLDAEINPILAGFRAWLLPTAAGTLLFALGIAVLLARSLSAPLVRLEATARRVRLGELDVEPLPIPGADEVGRLTGAFNEMVAGLRQREQIKGLFKRYLAPQVVEELIRHPEKAAPGGERRELTVLFSDLAGFTTLSEELSPEALVELLNTYFERATEALGRQGATLDKFIGDAIMAF
ncbi:MAG TPA: adenylate/guanylate cyclase domain-containing protein, partial [Myxococcaceae bacterium]|nr:adenylate/guanylate cyclase domain-containing protein [Myxococcaceae bacterium]